MENLIPSLIKKCLQFYAEERITIKELSDLIKY